MESLKELYHDTTWRADTGFKNDYLDKLECMLEAKIPDCGLKASPHIESRVKTLKLKYFALTEMLSLSRFGWNEEKMMLVCEKSVYDEWVEGLDDFDASFAQPNTQQQRPTHSTSSVANNSRNKRPKVVDEMTKQCSSMAQAIAGVGPKLDGLVHVLSTEINLTELQEKLHGELSKMEFLTSLQLFKVTNFLAKEHDLLRGFFIMHDESKREYVTTLWQTWEQSGI
ncbi:ATPase WRNIP1 [Prunus yedoensis var. nudiflora]|uniref:ATPase WRNIP1 n=1 Tax=Prunus yedoensis var. nudiflora TaxID=2094558 RepID=A0A314YA21_PRUYE|nr:ATPase WRNIP1 [Prunus yedoensis var. nudiflora]